MAGLTQARKTGVDPNALALSRSSRGLWADAWSRLIRNKAAVAGMVVIVLFVLVAIFASTLAPSNPLQINDGMGFLPPAWVKQSASGKVGNPRFLLGTDTIGRDLFSRLLYGARVSMVAGLTPVLILLVLGTSIGMISGYVGGQVDNIIMRITDVFYAFPNLLLYIILMVTMRDTAIGKLLNGLFLLFIALAAVNWVGLARLVRGVVLSLREKEYVDAARCVGASPIHVMVRHILPNALSPIVVWTAFAIPNMIIVEAILGYLGIGLKPATDPDAFFITSWGVLMLEGQTAINIQPWILFAPSICVGLVVLAFTFVGDGLRDALDPRMRGTQ
jgi:ABC-type dipeptide/oligopeptide/nickel transport system permease subunit